MKENTKKFFRNIVKSIVYAYIKIVYRVQVKDLEKVPKEGSYILCANHRNYLDPPLLVVTCKKELRIMAKEELYKVPLFKLLTIIFDPIFVKRDSKDINALKTALKTLKDGGNIALFPEGTRNGIEKGEKVKDGAAFFALNSDAKVIPVGIKGGLKPFQKTTITYGEPIDFSEYKANKKDKETIEKVTSIIMGKIIELS